MARGALMFTLANQGSTTEQHAYHHAKRVASSVVLRGPARPTSTRPTVEQNLNRFGRTGLRRGLGFPHPRPRPQVAV